MKKCELWRNHSTIRKQHIRIVVVISLHQQLNFCLISVKDLITSSVMQSCKIIKPGVNVIVILILLEVHNMHTVKSL